MSVSMGVVWSGFGRGLVGVWSGWDLFSWKAAALPTVFLNVHKKA